MTLKLLLVGYNPIRNRKLAKTRPEEACFELLRRVSLVLRIKENFYRHLPLWLFLLTPALILSATSAWVLLDTSKAQLALILLGSSTLTLLLATLRIETHHANKEEAALQHWQELQSFLDPKEIACAICRNYCGTVNENVKHTHVERTLLENPTRTTKIYSQLKRVEQSDPALYETYVSWMVKQTCETKKPEIEKLMKDWQRQRPENKQNTKAGITLQSAVSMINRL